MKGPLLFLVATSIDWCFLAAEDSIYSSDISDEVLVWAFEEEKNSHELNAGSSDC